MKFTQKLLKTILILVVAFALIGFASSYTLIMAQSNSSGTNTNGTNANLTSTLDNKFSFGVTVVYESPHTVILTGKTEFSTDLWQALDIVKGLGFKIDAVTQVTEESSAIGNTRYLTPVYTIFLSK